MDRDLYQVLGVSSEASPEEIKKAYRALAVKYHPDKSTDPESNQRFQEISSAYQILSDPQKRQKYDLTGSVDDNAGQSNFGNFKFSFFTGGRPSADGEVEVTYDQLMFGGTTTYSHDEDYWVDKDGRPVRSSPCPQCGRFKGMFIQMLSCSFCQGSGVIYPRGTIRRNKETNYDISIPPKSWPGRVVEVSGKKFVLIPSGSETLLNSGLDLIYINKIDIF